MSSLSSPPPLKRLFLIASMGSCLVLGALAARGSLFSPVRRAGPDPALSSDLMPMHHTDAEMGALSVDKSGVRIALAPEHALPEGLTEGVHSINHKIRAGETLSSIWRRYGSSVSGVNQAAEALRKAGVSMRELKVGGILGLVVSGDEITALRHELASGAEVLLEGHPSRGYSSKIIPAELVAERIEVSGVIESSLAAAAERSGISYGVVDDLVDLFSNRIEFQRDLQPGDTFTISLVQQRKAEGGAVVGAPTIEEASIVRREPRGEALFAAIRHVGSDGQAHFYNESGELIGSYFLRYPLKFSRISSSFASARFHPVLGVNRPHNGVDFAAPIGTPVRAVADGVVVDAGYRGQGGNTVRISHGDRYSTAYLHLHRIAPGISKGSKISRGATIGTVGTSGLSTGPHLHFSLFDRGRYINPLGKNLPTMGQERERLPAQLLAAALQNIRRLHSSVSVAKLGRERLADVAAES